MMGWLSSWALCLLQASEKRAGCLQRISSGFSLHFPAIHHRNWNSAKLCMPGGPPQVTAFRVSLWFGRLRGST